MRSARAIALLGLVLLPHPGAAAGEPAQPDGWVEARTRFALAMNEITCGVEDVRVTSKHRTEADQARLAAQGYRPHPRSQHKLGLAWDLVAPEESLEAVRRLAEEKGFTALVMTSPVTGSRYLHVQRYVRSPLQPPPEPEPEAETLLAAAAPEASPAPPAEPRIEMPRPVAVTGFDFPRRLLRKKADGRIVLLLALSAEGRVLDVAIGASDLPEFEEFVADAVRSWTFRPLSYDGKPVAAIARLPVPIRVE